MPVAASRQMISTLHGPRRLRSARSHTLIQKLPPSLGVAGGLKDVILGDVVVATKVYGYESGKETPDGFRTRPDVQRSHHELQSRGRVIRLNSSWCERLDPIFWANR